MLGLLHAAPRRLLRSVAATVAALLTVALLPGAPAYAEAWLPVTSLGVATSGGAVRPSIAVNASGDTLAVWHSGTQAVAALRHGSTWGAPQTISDPAQGGLTSGGRPIAGLDTAGNATVTWQWEDPDIADPAVQVVRRPAGGAWGAPETVSAAGVTAFDPSLSVAPGGTVIVAWNTPSSVESLVAPGGGAFGAASPVASGLTQATAVAVSAGPGAGGVAVWRQRSGGSNYDRIYASRLVAGTWETPAPFTPDLENAYSPHVVTDAGGRVSASWWRNSSADGPIVESMWADPAGAWSTPAHVGVSGYGEAMLTALPGGGAAVAWAVSGAPSTAWVAVRDGGGVWAAPEKVAEGSGIGTLDLAAAPDGAITVVMQVTRWPDVQIDAMTRDPGGTWQAVTTLTSTGAWAQYPTAAADPAGHVSAAWMRGNGSFVAETTVLDRVGPAVSASVPGSGVAGEALAFAVSATDLYSAPVSLVWDFGDGSSATGGAVSHVYAAPGTRTVTLRATDSSGNVTTRTWPVAVSAPAVPPTPPAPPTGAPPGLSTVTLKPKKISLSGHKAPKKARLVVTVGASAGLTVTLTPQGLKKKARAKHTLVLIRVVKPGPSTLVIQRKYGERTLAVARYLVTVTAINPRGTETRTLKLRVRR